MQIILYAGLRPGISIHPPRVGRDLWAQYKTEIKDLFQSTLPVWGGTGRRYGAVVRDFYFNPPSPCGEGLRHLFLLVGPRIFQSTLPVWGGT